MGKWWNEVNLKRSDGCIDAVKYNFIHQCEDTFEKHQPPVVTVRNGNVKVDKEPDEIWKKKETYHNDFQWYLWKHFYIPGDNIKVDCDYFIQKNGDKIVARFLSHTYGTIENAILQTETLNDLWNEFSEWFSERKQRFMEKMELEIKKGEIVGKKEIRSHGGVANLLKILTKTMKEQGADIRSVAKMQYMVCKQAGILLPDEFITDVATVLDEIGEDMK